ncbi:MAG: amino acid ABC transporter substrate-binding protein [Rhodospirillales bacterium]
MNKVLLAVLATLVTIGPAPAAEFTGTLKAIKDRGAIVVGHREESRPFSFVDGGAPAGYSIDLCNRVVQSVKQTLGLADLEVQYVPLTAPERMTAVGGGKVDLECGNSTITLARMREVDFSNMIFITGASLLIKADSGINGVGDLGGKAVGVAAGTTTEGALQAKLKQALVDAKVVTVKDHDEGLAKLESGAIDAYAGDQIVLIGLGRNATDPGKLMLAPELFTYEPYGLMVRRNDADFRLVVNATLAQLYRSGEIGQIYNKWFGDWGGRPARLLLAMFALNALPE